MAKVLVIGGAGYIGSHVVKALLQKGHQATVYDNLSTGQKVNLFEKAEFVEGDILDSGRLFDTMRGGFDAVAYLAAKKAVGESMENPDKYSINFDGDECQRHTPHCFFFVGGGLRNA